MKSVLVIAALSIHGALEGLALGRVVISTTIGMEGIHANDRKEILVADTPEEFYNQLNFVINNSDNCKLISHSGRTFIEQNFDRSINAKRFYQFLQSLI